MVCCGLGCFQVPVEATGYVSDLVRKPEEQSLYDTAPLCSDAKANVDAVCT